MRNFKRFLTLALAVVMLVSAFAMGTSAAKFTDVDEENEYLAKAVNLLSYLNVTKGTSETTFGTDELVTREQMAAFIYRLMKKGKSDEGGSNTSAFVDLEDPTFFFMVSWANNQGIIKGTSATTFNPKGSITLQDAYTMIVRALGYETEETLAYPFGYIDVAEEEGVELNEGLDSSVSYTDALTRGDVAILLYNAFFAETGVAETKTVEREIGSGNNATWVLETVTDYPTFCEKYFDVIEVEYQAIATPNAYLVGEATETTDSFGYEAIHFEFRGSENELTTLKVPAEFYANFEDLGVSGEADEYLMSHFTMYVVVDTAESEIEEVLYAEPLMVAKNVTDIKLDTITTNNKSSYFDAEYTAKLLSGKVTLDGEVAYFYGAPYSYAKPSYANANTDELKYEARNAENLEFITETAFGKDNKFSKVTIEANPFIADYTDDYYAAESVELATKLAEVYVGGLYEADIFDVDGDGIYDYIRYMPYKVLVANTDDDFDFVDDAFDVDKAVYTNGAVIEGVEFEDEDLLIGYFDKDANYIKVAAVVEPIEGSITAVKNGTITINGETKVSVKDGWKFLEAGLIVTGEDKEGKPVEFVAKNVDWVLDEDLVKPAALENKDAKFYIYEDVLLATEGIAASNRFDSNLIIVTTDKNGEYFDEVTSKGVKTTFVYAWVDGEMQWIALDTEAEVYVDADATKTVYEAIEDKTLLNTVATYTVDGKGLYTITPLAAAYDEDKEFLGLDAYVAKDFENEEDDKLQGIDTPDDGYLVKGSGMRFRLREEAERNAAEVVKYDYIIGSDATIVIRNEYVNAKGKNVLEFIPVKAEELEATIEQKLENIQVVVENNVDYTNREDLVLLFAEVNGVKFELESATTVTTKSERIVKNINYDVNEDGEYYAYYELLNPYTGEIVADPVAGTEVGTKTYKSVHSIGDVVELVNGKVDDEYAGVALESEKLYFVVDYVAAENALEVVEVPDSLTTGTTLEDYIDGKTPIRLNVEDAAVTVIKGALDNENTYLWPNDSTFFAGELSKLNGSDKAYLAYNANYQKEDDDDFTTVYGQYVKVILGLDEDDLSIGTPDKNGFEGEVNYIIVNVHGGEKEEFCKIKK